MVKFLPTFISYIRDKRLRLQTNIINIIARAETCRLIHFTDDREKIFNVFAENKGFP